MERSRSFNNILQTSRPFISKIVSELEKPESTLRSKEEDPIGGSNNGTDNIDGCKPSNVDDIRARDSVNEHLFSTLRLTTTGAPRSVLFRFEPNFGRLGDGREARIALQNKYQNSSRQRRRILLHRLDNSVMKINIDADVFLLETNQIRDDFSDLDEAVLTERLTTITLDALKGEITVCS